MKEHRTARGRDRKPHLSPDAERLVSLALGLANAGSRIEDRFWEGRLRQRLEKLLDGGHAQSIHDALDVVDRFLGIPSGIDMENEGSEAHLFLRQVRQV